MRRALIVDGAIALGLAGAVWVLYGAVLRLWWTHDDFFVLRTLITGRPFWYLFDVPTYREFGGKGLTPVLFFSLDVDRRLFGLDPRPFYVHQLVGLSICASAIYGAARFWLARPWSMVAAWVFLIGPATGSLASLLMVRHHIAAIALSALSVLAWALALRSFPHGRAWGFARLSGALYVGASFTKEIVAVPLVLLLPLLPARGVALRDRLRLAWPHALGLAGYLLFRSAMLSTLLGSHGLAVRPADLPALALELPGKVASEFLGGRPTAAAAWIVVAAAFAAGCGKLAASGAPAGRVAAVVIALVATLSGLVLNRQDWRDRYAEIERMSAENRFVLDMREGDVLSRPLMLAASLEELGWMKEAVYRRPHGGRWFQDDLFLCRHPDLRERVWGYDAGARRVVEITAQIPARRDRHCAAIRAEAPLTAGFRVAGTDLLWELGPYRDGKYRFVLGDGGTAFDIPPRAGFQMPGQRELTLRVGYESPEGWLAYSPELVLRIADGWSLRWSR